MPTVQCPALPRVMWQKYCSFSFATFPINSLSRPNSVNIESFVRCSCHEMLSIFLQHHISKASILFLSDFFKVHPSTPYWNTAHNIDFMTWTFVAVFISPYRVAFGVILSLLFVCFLVCTVEDISTQDGAIGVKFWLRVEQTQGTGTR